jgi:hypothetical protein
MKAEKNNAVFLKNEQVTEQSQKKVNFKELFWDVFNKLSKNHKINKMPIFDRLSTS